MTTADADHCAPSFPAHLVIQPPRTDRVAGAGVAAAGLGPAGKVTLAADAETVTAGLTSQLPDQPPADPHCTVCLVAAHSGDLLLYTPVMVLLQALLAVMVLTRLRGIRVPTVVHSLSRAPPAPFPVA